MLVRILTGVIGAPLLLALLFFCPQQVWVVFVAVVCFVAMYELLGALQIQRCLLLRGSALVFAFAAPFFIYLIEQPHLFMLIGAVYAAILMFSAVFFHERISFERVGTVFFLSLTSILSLASLAYMRYMNHGLLYILITLVIPWMSDTGAYFTGTFLGKHKLCPKISPKKTVEGLIGGLIFSVFCAVLTGFLYALATDATVILWRVAVLAAVCAPISVVGDLFASVLKRQHKIKDYGKIFPGHGGVMDRCDSVASIAWLVLSAIQFLPLTA